MSEYIIYHNPRCRKSRETLALLQEKGIEPVVRLYLEDVPKVDELEKIAVMLGMKPIEFTRRGETVFKELGLSKETSDEELLACMAAHPILMERPIVVKDLKKAVIGRPPENVLKIL
ncbi:MAG: arsenate reductase (glutaredoxin) [Candidatus Gracilibacteria bacterium]|nr:arsenate reductase (glutaredoxin) [Candidatus Gracilibacteria bacterium]